MTVISFYADKIAHLAKLSINNPGHRRPSFEQRYEMSMLRDDLSATRRAQLEAGAEDGFNFEITEEDLDLSKVPAGVWLVGDSGIYIMSNISMSEPNLVTEPIEHAVQSCETDIRNVGFDGQWDAKRDIFGGRCGSVFLYAEFILAACKGAKGFPMTKQMVMLDLGEETVSALPQAKMKVYVRAMQAEDPQFFDPDAKGPGPELWCSPKAEEDPGVRP